MAKNLLIFLLLIILQSPISAKAGCMDVKLGVARETYCLEVADTNQTREAGLQGRKSLPKLGGMLFIFPDDAQRVFWMKKTLMTLDIVFLDNDGIVRSLASRVSPGKIKLYSSARYVIELAGGTAEKLDLWPGDRVLFNN